MRLSRSAAVAGLVLCAICCWCPQAAIAEEARLALSDGHLAFQTETAGKWSVLEAGDVVPDNSAVRTSGAGVVRIVTGTDVVTLGPETSAHWDSAQRSIVLSAGRMLLTAEGDSPWSLSAPGLRVTAGQGSSVSLAAEPGSMTLDVLRGEVQVDGDAVERRTLAAPAAIAIRGTTAEVAAPDAADWAQTAAAWARPPARTAPGNSSPATRSRARHSGWRLRGIT